MLVVGFRKSPAFMVYSMCVIKVLTPACAGIALLASASTLDSCTNGTSNGAGGTTTTPAPDDNTGAAECNAVFVGAAMVLLGSSALCVTSVAAGCWFIFCLPWGAAARPSPWPLCVRAARALSTRALFRAQARADHARAYCLVGRVPRRIALLLWCWRGHLRLLVKLFKESAIGVQENWSIIPVNAALVLVASLAWMMMASGK